MPYLSDNDDEELQQARMNIKAAKSIGQDINMTGGQVGNDAGGLNDSFMENNEDQPDIVWEQNHNDSV